MSKIIYLDAKTVKDSRGDDTVEAMAGLSDGGSACASVPRGKSRGSFEAAYVDPAIAAGNVKNIIGPALKDADPGNQKEIDDRLVELDGTPDKSRLGANAILAVSLACARAGALSRGVFLWRHIRELAGREAIRDRKPMLFMNVVNGGLHARNNLDFQEYLIIPQTPTAKEAAEAGSKIRETLADMLGDNETGQEGGLAPDFKDNLEPFRVIKKAIAESGIKNTILFGLDAAASNIKKGAGWLGRHYEEMIDKYGLYYLEDPFGEDSFDEFATFKKETGNGLVVVGDDLTATNTGRMADAYRRGSVNGVIIKPNQAGTLTETLSAIRLARSYDWTVVVSHRSGETDDSFIADLAYGVGAEGIKLGVPFQKERLAKFGRLLEIEGKEDL